MSKLTAVVFDDCDDSVVDAVPLPVVDSSVSSADSVCVPLLVLPAVCQSKT